MPLPDSFHPVIREWFTETYGKPTAVQAEAWPLIENGEHVLALAPTGSGKTLTAFLSAISRFCPDETGNCAYPANKLTVLYISPLKALNEDINRNLLAPLEQIRPRFERAGLTFPPIRAETRSGDTPQSQRRRFLTHPPSILALTPESLAILLLNPRGRQILSTIKYLILDEIHAVLGNKRGAFLSCQIDRLALAAGEFQRISLSATIRAPHIAAEFAGGISPKGIIRPVRVVSPHAEKKIELRVDFSDESPYISRSDTLAEKSPDNEQRQIAEYGNRYAVIVNYILTRISANSTILVFTDSRRRCERLCYFINHEYALRNGTEAGQAAFTHHGSLSPELRRAVEQRLAAGTLPCVVATSSLELGIDIGSVDEVVLAGCPSGVSQALQRIGRAGHGVGKVSRAVLFPFHGLDLLASAALETAARERDIEEIRPVENPLDILAQIILALCVEKNRNIEELYTLLTNFYIFRNLSENLYLRTLRMLAGLDGGELPRRMREIKPRIWIDAESGETGALPGVLPLLYSSGGVITSRGLYSLRLRDGTKIGELDEEFVWERRLGDCFDFGGQGWRVTAIGSEAMEAVPLGTPGNFIPFWKADTMFRSPNLSRRVLDILENHDDTQINSENDGAIPALRAFINSQRLVQGACPLPGSANIAIEIITGTETGKGFFQVLLHTFRGGAVNYPFALAAAQELEEILSLRVECFSDDNAILLFIPRPGPDDSGFSPFARNGALNDLLERSLAKLGEISSGGSCRAENLLKSRLESTGLFGAAFREASERSLLIPRAFFGRRTPLWITRQRSKRLFDAVSGESDFPITAEAWRSCLKDSFDMDGFRNLSSGIHDGTIALSFFTTASPSPFAKALVRQETNEFIYEYDERKDLRGSSRQSSLSDSVIQEALGDASLRPPLKPELVKNFVSRLRREIPGWTAEDAFALSEWVKERVAIPLDEWEILSAALPENLKRELGVSDTDSSAPVFPRSPLEKIAVIKREGAAVASLVHREWEKTWKSEALSLLGQWLRYEGPVSVSRITEVFGVSRAEAEDAAAALAEINEAVTDTVIQRDESDKQDTAPEEKLICDRENLDMLLRLSRKKERPEVKERPATVIVPFLALRQGIAAGENPKQSSDNSFWKKTAALPAPAKLWETEIFPARDINYSPNMLDRQIQDGGLVWFGHGKQNIGLCAPEDIDLVFSPAEKEKKPDSGLHGLLPETQGRGETFFDSPRDFWEIKEQFAKHQPNTATAGNDCVNALWHEVWQGRLSADSFEPVRRGIETGFGTDQKAEQKNENQTSAVPASSSIPSLPGRYPRIPRALRDRWKNGAPVTGRWYSLALENDETDDPLNEELLNRDRVRLLLRRWGILCRPLLERESPPFSWARLLPAMRRMELAGELIAGRFFAGINSLQFASPAILRELEKAESLTEIYWMNAADPASPAGLEIDGLPENLPARSPRSRLYFRGTQLIAVSNRSGKELHIFITPEDNATAKLITLLKLPRTRNAAPEKKLLIEKINGEAAASSAYAGLFREANYVADRGTLCLW